MEKDIYMNGAKASFQSAQNCLNQSDVLAFFLHFSLEYQCTHLHFLHEINKYRIKRTAYKSLQFPELEGRSKQSRGPLLPNPNVHYLFHSLALELSLSETQTLPEAEEGKTKHEHVVLTSVAFLVNCLQKLVCVQMHWIVS